MVYRRMGDEWARKTSGGREDRAENQAHDRGPKHPSPSSRSPDLVERRERDRGRYYADEGHQKPPEKELFSSSPGDRDGK